MRTFVVWSQKVVISAAVGLLSAGLILASPHAIQRISGAEKTAGHGIASPSGDGGGQNGPYISNFEVVQGPTVWTFTGVVTDPNQDPTGLTITFGGVLAGQTVTVADDGTFTFSMPLPGGTSGNASAQTTDTTGAQSNVAVAYVG